jgi:hypothetical protein
MYFIGTICIILLLTANTCKKPCVPGKDPECTDVPPPDGEYVTPPNDAFVENFPDGEFEKGFKEESVEGVKFDDYSSSWIRTLNGLAALPPDMGGSMALLTAKKAKEPVGGYFALNMTTVLLQLNAGTKILIPGAVGTISESFINEFLDQSGKITVRKDFSEKPTALKGYMKYAPVRGDSAAIEIELYNGADVIGRGLLVEKRTINNWVAFEVPIHYSNAAAAVTGLKLIFSSSAGYNFNDLLHCVGQAGSSFTIDRIWWTF